MFYDHFSARSLLANHKAGLHFKWHMHLISPFHERLFIELLVDVCPQEQ